MIRADMHVHTYYSDGGLSPADAVNIAVQNGVAALFITDHDNTEGSEETVKLCRERRLLTAKSIEISAYDGDVKVHMLGYGIDDGCKAYRDFYENLMRSAELRARDITEKLKASGVDVTYGEAAGKRRSPCSPVHAMHIAAAAAEKGYAASAGEFFAKYLDYGAPAFSCIGRPSPERALEVVHSAGGICSVAHPGRIALGEEDKLRLIKRLSERGLDGIEAVYSGHTVKETVYYREIARRFSLLVTGGSDTHFPTGGRKIGTPEFYPSEELLRALKLI